MMAGKQIFIEPCTFPSHRYIEDSTTGIEHPGDCILYIFLNGYTGEKKTLKFVFCMY